MSGDDFCCVRKLAEDKNFAPKQNERDCPMTNGLGKAFIYEGCKQIYLSAGNDLATFRVSLTK